MDEETKTNLKKMRIQLYDTNLNQVEDRLVSQDTEVRKGPGGSHKGPMRLEFCIFNKQDVEDVKAYLDQLSGNLPLTIKVPKGKKLKDMDYDENEISWRTTLVGEILNLQTQDEQVALLREKGFVFVTEDHLEELGMLPDNLPKKYRDLQWMIKLVKEAKNLLNNKYDPNILFGYQLFGEKEDNMVIYAKGMGENEFTPLTKPWKKKNAVTFKKSDMAKFPVHMIEEERTKFRVELYKHRKDPDLRFSKFFKRWYKDVEFREKDKWADIIETLGVLSIPENPE